MTRRRLTLDFGRARTTACHCYTGVVARIDDEPPRVVTLTPDGCHAGSVAARTTGCRDPFVDGRTAEAVMHLLTGASRPAPRGDGTWNEARTRVVFELGRPLVMM